MDSVRPERLPPPVERLPPRLERLPRRSVANGLWIVQAATPHARLVGLAFLGRLQPGLALMLESCAAVHTFGMRFPLDLLFLDARGAVVRVVGDVSPRRLVRCPGARAVLETTAGEGVRFVAALPAAAGPTPASRPAFSAET